MGASGAGKTTVCHSVASIALYSNIFLFYSYSSLQPSQNVKLRGLSLGTSSSTADILLPGSKKGQASSNNKVITSPLKQSAKPSTCSRWPARCHHRVPWSGAWRRGEEESYHRRGTRCEELLLFLDEPTSGLDSAGAASIIRLLRKLANGGQAILCIRSLSQARCSSRASITSSYSPWAVKRLISRT